MACRPPLLVAAASRTPNRVPNSKEKFLFLRHKRAECKRDRARQLFLFTHAHCILN